MASTLRLMGGYIGFTVAGTSYTPAANDSYFGGATSPTQYQTYEYHTATFVNLFTNVTYNDNSGTSTLTFNKNGTNGNMTLSVPATTTGFYQDLVGQDSVVSGDLTSIQTVISGTGTNGFSPSSYGFYSQGSSVASTIAPNYDYTMGPALTYYRALTYFVSATEATATPQAPIGLTVSNLYFSVSSNTITATSTVQSRNNGANGNLSVSIPSSTSGAFQDTTHTDSVTAGNTFNFRVATGGTGTTLAYHIQTDYTASDNSALLSWNTTSSISFGTTSYLVPAISTTQSSETYVVNKSNASITFKGLEVKSHANSVNAATTIKSRSGTSNGNLSISVPASSTGWFTDLVHSDSVTQSTDWHLQIVTGGTSGTFLPTHVISTALTNAVYNTYSASLTDSNSLSENVNPCEVDNITYDASTPVDFVWGVKIVD